MGIQKQGLCRFSIFIQLVFLSHAQDPFWTEVCFTGANYTQNSPYRSNLDDVLFSLTRTNNGFGFYNISSGGTGIDAANAAALCRGDIQPDTCQRCVDDATRKLRQVCPTEVGAVGWYDNCYLRYSNRTILGDLDNGSSGYGWNNNNFSDNQVDQLNQVLGSLFTRLQGEAAAGGSLRKYAVGNTSEVAIFPTMYGMVQCIPELSESQCNQCLEGAFGETQTRFRNSIGVRIYKPSCILRYETYRFFNDTWFPTPSVPGKKETNVAVIVGPTLAVAAAAVAILVFFICNRRRRKRNGRGLLPESRIPSNIHSEDEWSFLTATDNFSLANKLGEGGFGPVYRGKLKDGKEVAVKRFSRNSGQGLEEFKTEVRLIIKLQHKNLVRLLGWCTKGSERLLVYEYMANTSLDAFLFDPVKSKELDWGKRANIVSGIAKGLRYLHEDSRLKIIHRDMKASNVLLDDEMNAKISDFGTARIFGVNQSEALTTRVVGTYGYMAPEYAMEGLFSIKSDVYSFRVLLLEIICGQKSTRFLHQDQPQNLLSFAWHLWKEGKAKQLIDKNVRKDCPIDEVVKWVNIALLCVQEDPQERPTMSSVVFMLEGQSTSLPEPSEPPLSYARVLVSGHQSTTNTTSSGFPSMDQTSTSGSG